MGGKVNTIMAHDCNITQRLLRSQRTMFRLAERDHGITQSEVHHATKMSLSAIGQYARGETAMSGPAIMKLAAWQDFPSALLSILFSSTERAVCDVDGDGDHAAHADNCIQFASRYTQARHPESEAGTSIGPSENRELTALRKVRAA